MPPGELPKLDDRAPGPLADPGGAPVVLQDLAGKPVEVVGEFGVNVTTSSQSVDFMSPLHCSVESGQLRLDDGDQAQQSFALTDIQSTGVYRYKKTLSTTLKALAIAAGVAATFYMGYALAGMEAFPSRRPQ